MTKSEEFFVFLRKITPLTTRQSFAPKRILTAMPKRSGVLPPIPPILPIPPLKPGAQPVKWLAKSSATKHDRR
jgi:hypothetical protein